MPRRLAFVGPYDVAVLDYEEAPLGAHEVRVKTEWASGKHGTTTAMFDGGAFKGQTFDLERRLFIPSDEEPRMPTKENPWHAGTSGVGTVIEVGEEVTRWVVGDRVFGLMDICETNVCSESQIWDLADVDPTLALCIEPAYVAFHAVRESHVRFGSSVAVIGLGALGLLAVRMAHLSGAERLFAVDPLPKRRAWAAKHGADIVLDPNEIDVALEIHDRTDKKGVDIAIELSGAYPGLATAIRSVRVGGTVCSAGFYQREAHGMWLGREWHHNRLTLVVPHGCGWGHPPRDYPRWDGHRAYDCIAHMMQEGKLSAPDLIQPIISLDEGPEVFKLIRDRPNDVIKYAVRF
jgi:threonine dehydrogenase-like Zn-dependent dehydrogenase